MDHGWEFIEATLDRGRGLGLEMEMARSPFTSSQQDQKLLVVVVSDFKNLPDGSKGPAEACGKLSRGDVIVGIDGTHVEPGIGIGEVANRCVDVISLLFVRLVDCHLQDQGRWPITLVAGEAKICTDYAAELHRVF